MYDQMIRNGFRDGHHLLPSFGSFNMRQTFSPIMQGVNEVPFQWNPVMASPYTPAMANPYFYPPQQEYSPYPSFQQTQSQTGRPSYAQNIFHNPLHEPDEYETLQNHAQPSGNGYPYMNPYPKASFLSKSPSGVQSVLNSFKSQDGSLDVPKMVDTAGQMLNAVSQVTSVVKGFSGMFKV